MPLFDKVIKYSVSVFQTNFQDSTRQIRLTCESGGTVTISFPTTLPSNWLQFFGADTSLFMTADHFMDVYHVLQTENPVFFTALDFFGLRIGHVHTELDLSQGETPGEGDQDPQSLMALMRRAHREGRDRA